MMDIEDGHKQGRVKITSFFFSLYIFFSFIILYLYFILYYIYIIFYIIYILYFILYIEKKVYEYMRVGETKREIEYDNLRT